MPEHHIKEYRLLKTLPKFLTTYYALKSGYIPNTQRQKTNST